MSTLPSSDATSSDATSSGLRAPQRSAALASPTVHPDELATLLPHDWMHLPVSGVERTVLIGPGGLVVLVARRPAARPTDPSLPTWNGEERRRPSSAQVIAEHVAHLVSERTGLLVGCKPVVVLADDDTRIFARLDDVAVLHRRRLAEWLGRRPRHLDASTISRVRAAFGPTATPVASTQDGHRHDETGGDETGADVVGGDGTSGDVVGDDGTSDDVVGDDGRG